MAAAYCYEEIPLRFFVSLFDIQMRYLLYMRYLWFSCRVRPVNKNRCELYYILIKTNYLCLHCLIELRIKNIKLKYTYILCPVSLPGNR